MDYDFDERPYTVIKEDDDYQKQLSLWNIAKGLQAVDNLSISSYMEQLIEKNLNHEVDYMQIEDNLRNYYATIKDEDDERGEEADFTTLRIKKIISMNTFRLSPATLLSYHKLLFQEVTSFKHPVGKLRQVNISKNEEVLNGISVDYVDYSLIVDALNYDFNQESQKNYQNLNVKQRAEGIMKFISSIWQIHPFREGNTRTCAVFLIMYLKSFGFYIDNEPFKKHSKFFRDALVLANAPINLRNDKYLKMFLNNLLFNEDNELIIKSLQR